MKKLIEKLSSRKLWIAICGLVVGIAAAFGIEGDQYTQIAGVVTSAISVASYIFGESTIDAKAVSIKNDSSDSEKKE